VIYPGSTPVGNATLVVANVLTCNKHSQYSGIQCAHILMQMPPASQWVVPLGIDPTCEGELQWSLYIMQVSAVADDKHFTC
jgi:hypothetical protein